jgi:hypothetical protein
VVKVIIALIILSGCADAVVTKQHPIKCTQSIYVDEYTKNPDRFIFLGIQCINL